MLPTYVAEEWKEVASAMQSKCGTENTVKALTDVLILLSTIAGKQTNVEMTAIQLCLNHYMISIKVDGYFNIIKSIYNTFFIYAGFATIQY